MGLLARTCLPAAIALSVSLSPAWVEAASKRATKTKTQKKRAAKKSVKKAKAKKVTAKTIARWQKQKMPREEIVEKAAAAGYKVTKLEKRKLLRYKVKRPLIAQLEGAQKAAPAPASEAALATKTPLKFDLEKTMDPNDIDFDSVPPPKGMPTDLAKKQRDEAEKKPAPAPAPRKSDDNKEKRVVIAAGK